jgi:hypothetical protein
MSGTEINDGALVDLVTQVMACGVMWFADNRDRIQRDMALDPNAHRTPFHLVFTEEAEAFLKTRADLVEALTA